MYVASVECGLHIIEKAVHHAADALCFLNYLGKIGKRELVRGVSCKDTHK